MHVNVSKSLFLMLILFMAKRWAKYRSSLTANVGPLYICLEAQHWANVGTWVGNNGGPTLRLEQFYNGLTLAANDEIMVIGP